MTNVYKLKSDSCYWNAGKKEEMEIIEMKIKSFILRNMPDAKLQIVQLFKEFFQEDYVRCLGCFSVMQGFSSD